MKRIALIAFIIITWSASNAQSLDRISISSGSKSNAEVNYVIGENFNFSMSGNGNIIIETGTLGSTQNTGGLPSTVSIQKLTELKKAYSYPNPAKDAVYFSLNDKSQSPLYVNVFDLTGKLLISSETPFSEILKLDLQTLSPGNYITTVSNPKAEVLGSFQFTKQ